MLYHAYEFAHAALSPMRAAARFGKEALDSPFNPFAPSYGARATSAAFEMFINATRRYGKPEFGLEQIEPGGRPAGITEEVVMSRPFCNLVHFRRDRTRTRSGNDPRVLIVAPMSGHFATLLRGTVRSMLPEHDVYITDWVDAREVPLYEGRFDLDDYIDYVTGFTQFLGQEGERVAIMAVCQPGVPVLAAAALMAAEDDPLRPSSVTLMGSPIDTARNPKQPNTLATERPLSWFQNNVIVTVPWPHKGFLRRVYPGFLQLSGFMSMNLDRHVDAHLNHFRNLIRGDGDSAAAHRSFYDEYLAVMDLTEEFYLQTIDRVFQRRLLARGEFRYRDRLVEPSAITDIGFLTVEGEKDDITGLGQTEAAHDLLTGLPDDCKDHYIARKVGHYGVFNGSRWRGQIQPHIRDFIRAQRRDVRG